jgi:hypothetical protein
MMKDREIERTRLLLERLAERLSRHVLEADQDMKHVPQGMTNFFRGFYYMKSGD